jgi:hypothetical protein
MKAKVSSLYRNGRNLPTNKVSGTAEGDLNLAVSKHPVTGRCTHEACVLNDDGHSLLPDLYDVTCVSISAAGFRLRGIEIKSGREVSQEWWCMPMLPNAQAEPSRQ